MPKVLVTFEEPLLRRIDRTARDRGLTRSAYLSELARDDLDRRRGPGADPAVHAAIDRLRALSAVAGARGGDMAAELRRQRDARADRLA